MYGLYLQNEHKVGRTACVINADVLFQRNSAADEMLPSALKFKHTLRFQVCFQEGKIS
jgi:hypothetical protein